jgi:formamidopyrimidine-DNA glycosylase
MRGAKKISTSGTRNPEREEDNPVFLVLHLMVTGRLRWSDKPDGGIPGKVGLCALDFENGTLLLTEAAKKKRASIHLVSDVEALTAFDRGGLELFDITSETFADRLKLRNHTLKRALTDPSLFSGIGGSFADEILHAAKLSPVRLTRSLDDIHVAALFAACRKVLATWSTKLIEETGGDWPKVTAFHGDMAVHGRFGQPCPACGHPVQRIVYAERETNYCATCQNDGRLLANRSLSRLLKKDWPKTIEEWEDGIEGRR